MSQELLSQLQFGILCLLYGGLITCIYDFLRIFRRVVRHKMFWVSVEDFLYWIFVAIGIFLVLYYTNDGNLRWIAIVVSFLGMVFYKKIFKDKIVIFMSTIIRQTLDIVVRVLLVPQRLVKQAFVAVSKVLKRWFGAIKKRVDGQHKKG